MTIEISRLRRQFGHDMALDEVNLTIADGEFVALLGPSGSGKTSLLRILAGLDYPDGGTVRRDGEDLLALDARRRRVGLVFQHYALFPHMTVAQNIAFGLRVRPWRERPRAATIKARVNELLKRVELEGFASRYPAQLSGGQRQRVALARALAIEPKWLLLDEPFGALDAQVRANLRGWLREFHRSSGITTLFVTHDQDEALEMADRVVVMNRGRIEQIGTPEQIHRHPATPFVSRFIARSQPLPALLKGNMLEVLGRTWPLNHIGVDASHAMAVHVRPEDIALVPQEDEGWHAELLNVRHVAGTVRASLRVTGVGESLDAVWSERDWQRHNVSDGKHVKVHFHTLTVFAQDGEGRVHARVDIHPPHVASPVTVGPWRRLEA
jgi:sulfate/thiosulfate transport system ATP-binding protein